MGLFDWVVDTAVDHILPGWSVYRHRHDCPVESMLQGDTIKSLPPGTPVYCNFTLGVAEHSGICVGDTIVHLDGTGEIIETSPQVFLERLEGKNAAVNIYYAARGKNRPLASKKIAERALDAVGDLRDYNLLTDNCHGFTARCITGDMERSAHWTLGEIEDAITKTFGTDDWKWRNWEGWKNN